MQHVLYMLPSLGDGARKAQTSLGLKREAFGNFRRPRCQSCRLHSLPIFKNTFEKNTSKSKIPIRNLQ